LQAVSSTQNTIIDNYDEDEDQESVDVSNNRHFATDKLMVTARTLFMYYSMLMWTGFYGVTCDLLSIGEFSEETVQYLL
jgi:putative methionine-R-sulfoxide reductase with GAF domain